VTDTAEADTIGPCGKAGCDHGWRTVTDRYVDTYAPPWPEPPGLGADAATEAAYEADVARVELARRALARSVYPCKECHPKMFYRWVGGHWSGDHVPDDCADCQEGLPHHRRKARRDQPTSPAAMAERARAAAAAQGDTAP
jgi:hypothetical protein